MYGLWYIFIGVLSIAIVMAIVDIVMVIMARVSDKKLKIVRKELSAFPPLCYNLVDEDSKKRAKWDKLYERYFAISCYDGFTLRMIYIIAAVISICILLFAIFVPLGAKNEVNTYKQSYAMVERVIERGEGYENVGITQTIIDYNMWLSKAKADKKTYGCFSQYYYENLDSLDYICINPTDTSVTAQIER